MTRSTTARVRSPVDRTFNTACRRLPVAAGSDLRQLTVLPRLQDEQQPVATLLVADGVHLVQGSCALTLSTSKRPGSCIDPGRTPERRGADAPIAGPTLFVMKVETIEGQAP